MASEMILYASPRLPELQEVKEILAETSIPKSCQFPLLLLIEHLERKLEIYNNTFDV